MQEGVKTNESSTGPRRLKFGGWAGLGWAEQGWVWPGRTHYIPGDKNASKTGNPEKLLENMLLAYRVVKRKGRKRR